MGAPQLLALAVLSFNIGKIYEMEGWDSADFFTEVVTSLIWIGLLCWGGFFG